MPVVLGTSFPPEPTGIATDPQERNEGVRSETSEPDHSRLPASTCGQGADKSCATDGEGSEDALHVVWRLQRTADLQLRERERSSRRERTASSCRRWQRRRRGGAHVGHQARQQEAASAREKWRRRRGCVRGFASPFCVGTSCVRSASRGSRGLTPWGPGAQGRRLSAWGSRLQDDAAQGYAVRRSVKVVGRAYAAVAWRMNLDSVL